MDSSHPAKPHSSQAIEEVLQNSTITANSQNWLLSYLDVFVLIIMLMITLDALTDISARQSPDVTAEKKSKPRKATAAAKPGKSASKNRQARIADEALQPVAKLDKKAEETAAAAPLQQSKPKIPTQDRTATAEQGAVSGPSVAPAQAQDASSTERPDNIKQAIAKELPDSVATARAEEPASTAADPAEEHKTDPDRLRQQQLREKLALLQLQDAISIEVKQGYAQLQIQDNILFDTAKATLTDSGKALLQRLIPLLRQSDGLIFIEGHTDNRPIATAQFPSNWELASARATSVLHFLVSQDLPAGRLRTVSYADTMPNASEAGRQKNRRVNILLKVPETGF